MDLSVVCCQQRPDNLPECILLAKDCPYFGDTGKVIFIESCEYALGRYQEGLKERGFRTTR